MFCAPCLHLNMLACTQQVQCSLYVPGPQPGPPTFTLALDNEQFSGSGSLGQDTRLFLTEDAPMPSQVQLTQRQQQQLQPMQRLQQPSHTKNGGNTSVAYLAFGLAAVRAGKHHSALCPSKTEMSSVKVCMCRYHLPACQSLSVDEPLSVSAQGKSKRAVPICLCE